MLSPLSDVVANITLAHRDAIGRGHPLHQFCAETVCQRYGVRIIKSLQNKDYGLRAFVFEDPDGNRIDVGQVT